MKKILCFILCCFLLGCQTAPKEVRFKNPLFYEKMISLQNDRIWTFLTPSSMTEVSAGRAYHFACDLLENEETYIVLNCQSVMGNNFDAITLQKDTIEKFEYKPEEDYDNSKFIQHFYRLKKDPPAFHNYNYYVIHTNDTK